MEKKKTNLNLVAGVLLIFFVLSLISMFFRINSRLKKKGGVIKNGQAKTSVSPLLETELTEYFSKLGIVRNPFALGGASYILDEIVEDSSGFRLSAIIWDEIKPMAIVNNKVVEIGSEINGAKIISIEKNKVKLISEGKTIEMELTAKGGKEYVQ